MRKIFVGNLDFDATEAQVRGLFDSLGEVRRVEIAKDWETGHSRGFAFVVMSSETEASRAVKTLNGKRLDGRPLTVRPAPVVPPVGFVRFLQAAEGHRPPSCEVRGDLKAPCQPSDHWGGADESRRECGPRLFARTGRQRGKQPAEPQG